MLANRNSHRSGYFLSKHSLFLIIIFFSQGFIPAWVYSMCLLFRQPCINPSFKTQSASWVEGCKRGSSQKFCSIMSNLFLFKCWWRQNMHFLQEATPSYNTDFRPIIVKTPYTKIALITGSDAAVKRKCKHCFLIWWRFVRNSGHITLMLNHLKREGCEIKLYSVPLAHFTVIKQDPNFHY